MERYQMENAIAIVESKSLTKQEVIAQKRLIQEVMKAVMIGPTEKNPAGVHYGIIPGCKLPTLYKAGSEVILSTFRIAVEPMVEDLSTHDCYRYRVTLRGIIPSGEVVGTGVGECSTDEEKYKWRGSVCDKEFENTPEDRRRIKYGKPNNWNKTGETKQVRTNPADLANTALKMAKKRAQIDLTLTATGASDVFAQDLEDLPEEVREEIVREENHQRQGKPPVSTPQSKPATDNGDKATEGQVKMLHVKIRQANITEAAFAAHYNIASVSDLPKSMVNAAIKAIGDGEISTVIDAETEDKPETVPCKNCGEQINPVTNTGHLLDCPYAAA